jgi:hypothetical protein
MQKDFLGLARQASNQILCSKKIRRPTNKDPQLFISKTLKLKIKSKVVARKLLVAKLKRKYEE